MSVKLKTEQDLRSQMLKRQAKKKRKLPDLLGHLQPSGDLEKDCQEEVSATLAAFKQRAGDEEKRLLDATDSEHWVALTFANREQKEAFLKVAGWLRFGDKYLDGRDVAEVMGIELPQVDLRTAKVKRGAKELALPRIE